MYAFIGALMECMHMLFTVPMQLEPTIAPDDIFLNNKRNKMMMHHIHCNQHDAFTFKLGKKVICFLYLAVSVATYCILFCS